MKKLVTAAIIVIAVVFVATNLQSSKSSETIKIGGIFELTGYGADWGISAQEGALLAIEEVNNNGGVLGKQLELIVEDNQTDQARSINAFQKLTHVDNIDVLLVGWSQLKAIDSLITNEELVTITVSAGAPGITKGNEYVYRTWPSDDFPIKKIVGYMNDQEWNDVAVVQNIGDWESGLTKAFKQEVEKNNMNFINEFVVVPQTKDFRTQIIQLKQDSPDAIYLPLQTDSLIPFLLQARELGLTSKLFWAVDLNTREVVEGVGNTDILTGVIYPVNKKPITDFDSNFKNRFDKEPGVTSATSYDAVMMLTQSIDDKGKFKAYSGASGEIEFDEFGDRTDSEVMLMTFDGHDFVELE